MRGIPSSFCRFLVAMLVGAALLVNVEALFSGRPSTASNQSQTVAPTHSDPAPERVASGDVITAITIPQEKAAELRERQAAAMQADRDLECIAVLYEARKWEAEAKRATWIGTQYKMARELNVPVGWLLNTEKMVFEAPPPAPPSGSAPRLEDRKSTESPIKKPSPKPR